MTRLAVDIKNLSFAYPGQSPVLKIDSLSIEKGSRIFLYGPSGCGKTTFLNLISGVLSCSQGEVNILGKNLKNMHSGQKDFFRGSHLGYIFQSFNLIPYLSAYENIMLPIKVNSERRKRIEGNPREKATQLAQELNIIDLLEKRVTELSIGQQQRVAAARALLGRPSLLVADEPTSALDSQNTKEFMSLLMKEWEKEKWTLIFVSHDERLKSYFERSLSLPDLNHHNFSEGR